MNDSLFKYMIEAKGQHYGHYINAASYQGYADLHETVYFENLKDAFTALLKWDITEFDKDVPFNQNGSPKYFDEVVIKDTSTGEALIAIERLLISEAIQQNEQAGIYMKINMDIPKLKQEIGAPFDIWDEAIGSSDFVLLAKYFYNDYGHGLSKVKQVDSFLRLQVQEQQVSGAATQDAYRIQTIEHSHGVTGFSETPHAIHTRSWHYNDIRQAFGDLIHIPAEKLDHHITLGQRGEDRYLHSAALSDVNGNTLLHLACVRDASYPDRVYAPGVHLSFSTGIKYFEEWSGINLSLLDYYGEDDKYQLIFEYNREFKVLMPTNGLLQLQHTLSDPEKPPGQDTSLPFVLQVEWAQIPEGAGSALHSHNELIRDRYFDNLDDAVRHLFQIDHDLFQHEQLAARGCPFYLKKARVFDTRDGKTIMEKSLHLVESPHQNEHVWMRMNAEKVSPELLLLIGKCIPDIKGVEGFGIFVDYAKSEHRVSHTPAGKTGARMLPSQRRKDRHFGA